MEPETNRIAALRATVEKLRADLRAALSAADVARQEATGEESKSEGKYDTRAIEAGYLAGAHARRVEAIRVALGRLELVLERPGLAGAQVRLVRAVDATGEQHTFLVAPAGAGTLVEVNGEKVRVVTAVSPLGRPLAEAEEGDEFTVKLEDPTSAPERWEVLEVESG